MPDPAETPTPQPTPEPAGSTQTPGQETGGSAGAEKPYKAFATKEEYEAAFGPTRNEGRKSLAKSLGFDTIEAFQEKWSTLTELEKQQMTELQRVQAERDQFKTQAETHTATLRELKLGQTLDELVAEAGIKPERKEAFLALRKAAEGEVNPQTGEVNTELVKHSVLTLAEQYPEFKAPPPTVNTGGVPPVVAGTQISGEEATKQAQGKGDIMGAIGAQLGKLFTS